MNNKISKKYIKKSDEYQRLAREFMKHNICFDDIARLDFYNYESTGKPRISYYEKYERYDNKVNGFAVGKHLYDLNIGMIKESLDKGDISKFELWFEKYPDYIVNTFLRKDELEELEERFKTYTNQSLKEYFHKNRSLPNLDYINMSEDPDENTLMFLYINTVYKNNIK